MFDLTLQLRETTVWVVEPEEGTNRMTVFPGKDGIARVYMFLRREDVPDEILPKVGEVDGETALMQVTGSWAIAPKDDQDTPPVDVLELYDGIDALSTPLTVKGAEYLRGEGLDVDTPSRSLPWLLSMVYQTFDKWLGLKMWESEEEVGRANLLWPGMILAAYQEAAVSLPEGSSQQLALATAHAISQDEPLYTDWRKGLLELLRATTYWLPQDGNGGCFSIGVARDTGDRGVMLHVFEAPKFNRAVPWDPELPADKLLEIDGKGLIERLYWWASSLDAPDILIVNTEDHYPITVKGMAMLHQDPPDQPRLWVSTVTAVIMALTGHPLCPTWWQVLAEDLGDGELGGRFGFGSSTMPPP